MIRIHLLAFAICLGISGQLASRAQSPRVPSNYVLGPDDVIAIVVNNHAELNNVVVIPPDGKLIFPEVGEIIASGKTPAALAAEIQSGLEKTYNNVSVSVMVKEIHSRRMRVVGAIKSPTGLVDLKSGERLVEALADAGGLITKASRVSAKLIRGGTQITNLDLLEALAHPEGPANIVLQPDDLVIIDETEQSKNQITVMGEVSKQGAYDFEPGMELPAVLVQAGGPTEKAALSKAYILRSKTEIPVNLYPVFVESKLTDPAASFKMQAGDVVVIPMIDAKFAVMGQVSKPGYYPLPEKRPMTVVDALNLAGPGGQTQPADLSKVGVIRNVAGKPTVTEVNVDKMLKTHDLTKNVALQPDDIVYVPGKRTRAFNWYDVMYPLSILNMLFRF